MKIKTTIIKTETIEKDIALPYFSRNGHNHFCILGEDEIIICDYTEYSSDIKPSVYLRFVGGVMLDEAMRGEEITQSEFNAVYVRCIEFIQSQLDKSRYICEDGQCDVQPEKSAA